MNNNLEIVLFNNLKYQQPLPPPPSPNINNNYQYYKIIIDFLPKNITSKQFDNIIYPPPPPPSPINN